MSKKKDSFFVRVLRDFIHSVPESADEKLQEKKNLAIRVLDRLEMAQGDASTGGDGELPVNCITYTESDLVECRPYHGYWPS